MVGKAPAGAGSGAPRHVGQTEWSTRKMASRWGPLGRVAILTGQEGERTLAHVILRHKTRHVGALTPACS
ncbi:hypothetical protein TIFTF001_035634 [Ficus carica]|uniref:Uncharacterized protein n=1 Tax=Ficus carica TaxID=3494 RepID=A0AA88E1X7_FICCA|nr:hypothetical protein TIFTF001_035634 [Ficus carica]